MLNLQSLSYERESYITNLANVDSWVKLVKKEIEDNGYTIMSTSIYMEDAKTRIIITALKGSSK